VINIETARFFMLAYLKGKESEEYKLFIEETKLTEEEIAKLYNAGTTNSLANIDATLKT
jgi:hypothetical protein